MLPGCRSTTRRLSLLFLSAGLLVVAPHAVGEDAATPTRIATTELSPAVRALAPEPPKAEHCASQAAGGYVPIVRAAPGTLNVPPEGRFVRCPSGRSVFVLPPRG